MERTLLPGRPYPLGATPTSKGTNFALYSENATGVSVCFFDESATRPTASPCASAPPSSGTASSATSSPASDTATASTAPGSRRRASASTQTSSSSTPTPKPSPATSTGRRPSFPTTSPRATTLKRDDQDSAAGVPRSIVIDDRHFDWEGDCAPDTPLADSIIYEVHVRGFSNLRTPRCPRNCAAPTPGSPAEPSINYLKKLGVTAVELLPVHHFIDEGHLVDRGLRDYWGYNTLGYFAPMSRYSSCGDNGCQVDEFKEMVKALHKAGIEVILDVVYNHTCEGNRMGPMLSLKGIDNTTYYRQVAERSALLHGLHRHRQHPQSS